MKKLQPVSAILIILCVLNIVPVHAQSRKGNKEHSNVFIKKSFTASFAFGVGADYEGNFKNGSAWGTKSALEYGVFQAGPGVVSIGAETGTSFSNQGSDRNKSDFKSRTIVVAARSAWHHNWNVGHLDTYAGISAGVGFHHEEYKKGSKYSNDKVIPAFGGFLGASYYITPSVAFNIEAGYDITHIQAGILFKLR